MSDWHEQFRAYARAFGKDEVAAILLRDDENEWLVWPKQVVEGLTFTLTADAILNAVPAENLQHVVGWVHSHPSGIDPSPSATDDAQIRELATDVAGQICEMWIFGGYGYELYSITKAVLVSEQVFVSDTVTWRKPSPVTNWDDEAKQLYKASKPAKLPAYPNRWTPQNDYLDYDGKYPCPLCQEDAPKAGELCDECDEKMEMSVYGGWNMP